MQHYNNLDVIPALHAFCLIMMFACGWVLLDEIESYDAYELLGLIGSSLLVFAGIKVITMKTSAIATLKKPSTPLESDLM